MKRLILVINLEYSYSITSMLLLIIRVSGISLESKVYQC